MSRQHFSATKSKLKSSEGQGEKKAAPAKAAPKAAAKSRPEPVSERQAATASPAGGQGDLLSAIEAMKPLVESLGKEQAHRIIELLG